MKTKVCVKPDTQLRKRVGKTLAYLLRYGAAREGLTLIGDAFVDLEELLGCSLLKGYEHDFLKSVISEDISYRGVKRFETKEQFSNGNSRQLVRATYGRQLEENPYHKNCKVKRLTDICLDTATKNVKMYDFSEFVDDYLTSQLISRLRRLKALNNVTLSCVLSASLEILDLEGCYLTPKSLAIVRSRCPLLRVLNLRRHGYLMTDSNLLSLLQGLTQLETLNLTCCHNLTDRSLECIRTVCPKLRHLNLFGVPRITDEALLNYLCLAEGLVYLDIFDRKFKSSLCLETATEVARQRGIVLLHPCITDPDVCPKRALTAHLGDRGRFW